jgi:putative polyketide hydroxylase
VARTAPWLAATQKTDPLAHDFDIEIGYLYGQDEVHADPRTTRGRPGSRLPHYRLEHGGKPVSTLDLAGRWLLLAGPEGKKWLHAAQAAAGMFAKLPLDARQVGKDLVDPAGQFIASVGIAASGAILVRPDGFVSWRAEHEGSDPGAELRAALGRGLAH